MFEWFSICIRCIMCICCPWKSSALQQPFINCAKMITHGLHNKSISRYVLHSMIKFKLLRSLVSTHNYHIHLHELTLLLCDSSILSKNGSLTSYCSINLHTIALILSIHHGLLILTKFSVAVSPMKVWPYPAGVQ